MFKHNLLIALRGFYRYKGTFFINLLALSIGLAGAILIFFWISAEMSIDQFNEKDEQLFVVLQNMPQADGVTTISSTPGVLAKTLKEEIPEIQLASSVIAPDWFDTRTGIVKSEEEVFKAIGQAVEQDYFNLFSIDILKGSKQNLLKDKFAVLISEELALKTFQTTEGIIGKTLEWSHEDFEGLYQIRGVYKKPQKTSLLPFDLIFNYEMFFDLHKDNLGHWGNNSAETYVLVNQEADIATLNAKIKNLIRSKFEATAGTEYLHHIGTIFLQPFSDRYLYGNYENGKIAGGRITYIWLFGIIALFLMVIASVNFINLSTAKATRRQNEIGVKKTVGATRQLLIQQFLGEAGILTFLSLLLALLLVALFLPSFNAIMDQQLQFQFSLPTILGILAIALFTGLMAGGYPALYLSRFKIKNLLSGNTGTNKTNTGIRKGLVVFQFSISVIAILGAFLISQQIDFVQNRNLGYDKEQVLSFTRDGRLGEDENINSFLETIQNIPGVLQTTTFGHDLVGGFGGTSAITWEGSDLIPPIQYSNLEIDYNWFELLGIEFSEGRPYSKTFNTENEKIIFNEAAINAMGLENPIGKTIKLWGRDREIIGVTKNFNFESLHEPVKPCFMQCYPNLSNVLVKLSPERVSETIQQLEQTYKSYNDNLAFEFHFLDEDYASLYAAERRIGTISQYAAFITILISCLGLFGLVTFMVETRRKEMSIRKVLGASVTSIVYLLSKDFVKLVFIAFLIATPIAYYFMNQWLQNFAYRIEIQWWAFALTGLMAIGIALLTVSFQSVRAALVNPVEPLRNE